MSLLSEANFIVIFIALIIIFFLLGFLFGRLTYRTSKEKTVTSSNNNINVSSKQQDSFGQDNQINDTLLDLRQDHRPSGSGRRYYNNYW